MSHEKHETAHAKHEPAKAKKKAPAASEATLRDMFAMHAMGSAAACCDPAEHCHHARAAYARADAMLAARDEKPDDESEE